ncbi:MAG: LptF/LptG family permease [Planctomycetota bacterium]
MKKIDRYVLNQFVLTLGVTTLVLSGLYLIVHFFTNIQEFTMVSHKNILGFIIKYYLYRIPLILLDLIPIITLVAAMVTITRFIKTNELTPMFSAGLSIYRILVPVFIIALVISILMFFIDEKIIPAFNENISQTDKILTSEGQERYILTYDNRYSTVLIKNYDYTNQTMHQVSITECNENNSLRAKLIAETASWEIAFSETSPAFGGASRLSQGWYLYNGVVYSYDESGFRKGPPRRFGPEGYLWSTDLTPADLAKTDDTLSYTESAKLKKMITQYPHQNYLKVKFYNKITFPLVNIILLLLGLPFVLIGESKNFFTGVGICLAVVIIFFMVQFFFESLGTKGFIHPLISAWFPLVFFGLIAVLLFGRVRT